MGKKITVFILSVLFFTFGFFVNSSKVKAQKFVVQFVDADKDGYINFYIAAINPTSTTYEIGIGNIGKYTPIPLLTILPYSYGARRIVEWPVAIGKSLTYDMYLSINGTTNYFWTSLGAATGNANNTSYGSFLQLNWLPSGNPVFGIISNSTAPGDTFKVVPVPLPSSFWFLVGGVILISILGITTRKKSMSC